MRILTLLIALGVIGVSELGAGIPDTDVTRAIILAFWLGLTLLGFLWLL